MRSRFFLLTSIALVMAVSGVRSQDTLKIQDALIIAMENNFDIYLAMNDNRLADLSNNPGNAGMLPDLSVTGSRSISVNNTEQRYFDGRERTSPNAKNNTISAGVALGWTLFDGFNMFIQKRKLEELENLSEIQLRAVVENTVAEVIQAYYAIITQEEMVSVYREAMAISAERKRIASAGVRIGSSSELSLLQASVDYNADSSALIQQQKMLQNAKIDLNRLLCRDLYTPFVVTGGIPVRTDLIFEKLWMNVQQENPEIRMARANLSMALLDEKGSKSSLYPRINLSSGYNFNKSESEVGIMQLNRNRGFSLGVNASYTIFDGFVQRQNRSRARILLESAQVQAEQMELEIKAHLQSLYNEYETNLQLSRFEKANVELAQRNLDIATEKYRIGSSNDIELRETQKKLMDAENRYLTALFRCKSSETELLRMSGGLK